MRHDFNSNRRPPWWPENEAWSRGGPPDRAAWRGQRGRFIRRFAGMMGLLLLVSCSGLTLLSWVFADLLGWIAIPDGRMALIIPLTAIVLAGAVAAAFRIGLALRRTVVPVGDIMEAANRVAGGDFSARVAENGTREVTALAQTFNSMVERLQTNTENRRRLLADVAHELRTPLTVIQGNVEGLIDGVYPSDETHLRAILDETQMLSRMINDLRTLSLVESGALELALEPIPIAELAERAVKALAGQAESAGVELRLDAQADLPETRLDGERIRSLIENLIANALRYTPAGGSIRVGCLAEEGPWVAVEVVDTGRGIPPEDLPHVFDRFYKSSDSRGMGLGLAIARGVVEAHGGEISAESEPGKGTRIRFRLPVGE